MNAAFRLLVCIGGIDDLILEEIESIAADAVSRKRLMRYGGLAAAASVGVAVACWWIKAKRAA